MAQLNELSVREEEVLRMMSEGCTTDEIGERLFLAPKTIKTYRMIAFRKLGARNAPHAVALWLKANHALELLEEDESA